MFLIRHVKNKKCLFTTSYLTKRRAAAAPPLTKPPRYANIDISGGFSFLLKELEAHSKPGQLDLARRLCEACQRFVTVTSDGLSVNTAAPGRDKAAL